jgi:hypothetical protein
MRRSSAAVLAVALLALLAGCNTTGRKIDAVHRDVSAGAVEVTVNYVYVPVPAPPELQKLDPSKHVGAVENVDILWTNMQRMQKYASDLEGALRAYQAQAEKAVADKAALTVDPSPEDPPK